MSIRTSSIANHARVVNFVRRFAAPALLLAAQTGCGEKSAAPIDARCVNLPATSACSTAAAPAAPTVSETIIVTKLDGIKDLVPTLNTPLTIGRPTSLIFSFPQGTQVPTDFRFSARLIAADGTSPLPLFDQNVGISGNTITIPNVTLAVRPGTYTISLMAYDRNSNLDKIYSLNDIKLEAAASGAQPTSTSTVRPPVPTSTGAKPPVTTADPCDGKTGVFQSACKKAQGK